MFELRCSEFELFCSERLVSHLVRDQGSCPSKQPTSRKSERELGITTVQGIAGVLRRILL
jgi:hypothetical protein